MVRLLPGERPQAQAELQELTWIDPAAPTAPHPIAPLSLDLLAAWHERNAGAGTTGTGT